MKKLEILLINLYQKVLHLIFKNILGYSSFCRFSPTCSQYAKIAIAKEGVLKGTYLATIRILKCQPLYKQI